jgi:5-methylcytosine-specific restriction endonuclease McrA
MKDLLCLVHVSERKTRLGLPETPSYSYTRNKCRCDNCIAYKKQVAIKSYEKNKEKIKIAKKAYYEKNKDILLKKMKIYYADNREHLMEYATSYAVENRERLREVKREYSKKHPEMDRNKNRRKRAIKKQNGFEKYSEQDVLSTYGTDCYLCGSPIDLSASRRCGSPGWELGLHIEHYVDIALGGPDTLENVRPSHAKCNLNKKPREMV